MKPHPGRSRRHVETAAARDLKEAQPVVAALLKDSEVLQDDVLKEFENEDAVAEATFRKSLVVAVALLVLPMFVALGVAMVVRMPNATLTSASSELRHNAEQVAAASLQVATSAQSLSQGATEQAASLEETSASMEEMASMTRTNSDNSQRAAGLVGESVESAAKGTARVAAVEGAAAAVHERFEAPHDAQGRLRLRHLSPDDGRSGPNHRGRS